MTTPSARQRAEWLYDWALLLERERIPYSFRGGHGPIKPILGPWGEWLPPTVGDTGVVGYDCSSYAYAALWRAGLAGQQFKEVPNTVLLEGWGRSGEGTYVTLRVFDGILPIYGGVRTEHCFLVVKGLGAKRPNAKFAAQSPGHVVGKFTAPSEYVEAFHARHPA